MFSMYNITLVSKLRKKKEQRQPVLESFQNEIVRMCKGLIQVRYI